MQTEAENLKRLFVHVKNRAEFARTHQVPGGASMIYQHINGLKPISLESAVAYARGFDVPLREISPRFADIIASLRSETRVIEKGQEGAELPDPLNKLLATARRMSIPGQYVLLGRAEELERQYPNPDANHRKQKTA